MMGSVTFGPGIEPITTTSADVRVARLEALIAKLETEVAILKGDIDRLKRVNGVIGELCK